MSLSVGGYANGRQYTRVPLRERIMRKRRVTEGGCWEYTGCLNENGYGVVNKGKGRRSEGGGTALVHRWIMGEPASCVLHHCDNPACFNPAHLYVGTRSDNMRDCYDRGRMPRRSYAGPRGTSHPHSTLADEDIIAIRERYRHGGVSQRALASDYGVSQTTIGKIVRGQSYVA